MPLRGLGETASENVRVIEFGILFGLGFLSAALLATLIAPAIYRRIVAYTEKRLRATMPISPQEVRAQKDMARALYAAENARTRQELETEREKALSQSLKTDTISQDAGRMLAENRDIKMHLEEMTVEAGDLRSKARKFEDNAQKLKTRLDASEETVKARATEIGNLNKRIGKVTRELDDLKIAASARDLEIEQARQKTATWRKEKETITKELEEASSKNREAANHMSRESRKIIRLEEQLAKEVARNADNENTLERRTQEITRLKERLTAVSGQSNDMVIRLQQPASAPKVKAATAATSDSRDETAASTTSETSTTGTVESETSSAPAPLIKIGSGDKTPDVIAREIEEIRNQGVALTERLLNVKGTGNDDAIRQEIALIAARMIALTAAQEGETSPIPALIANAASDTNHQNLATRANELMAKQNG
jgi:chromosome segregation ATPase